MLGILRKDLYDTFLIPKNILSNGFGYLFMFLFAYLLGPNYYMMMVFIMLAIPATSVMVLQAAIEQDESVRFDDVLLTYPISKKQIILTRFCPAFPADRTPLRPPHRESEVWFPRSGNNPVKV